MADTADIRTQLEIVAEHCDATGLRAGGAVVREVIDRIEQDRTEITRLTADLAAWCAELAECRAERAAELTARRMSAFRRKRR